MIAPHHSRLVIIGNGLGGARPLEEILLLALQPLSIIVVDAELLPHNCMDTVTPYLMERQAHSISASLQRAGPTAGSTQMVFGSCGSSTGHVDTLLVHVPGSVLDPMLRRVRKCAAPGHIERTAVWVGRAAIEYVGDRLNSSRILSTVGGPW
jgi:hypothetical protein